MDLLQDRDRSDRLASLIVFRLHGRNVVAQLSMFSTNSCPLPCSAILSLFRSTLFVEHAVSNYFIKVKYQRKFHIIGILSLIQYLNNLDRMQNS